MDRIAGILTQFTDKVRKTWDGPYVISIDDNVVSVKIGAKYIPPYMSFGGEAERERRKALSEAANAAGVIKRWVDSSISPLEDSWVDDEGSMGFVSDLFIGTTVKKVVNSRREWEAKHRGEVGWIASSTCRRFARIASRVAGDMFLAPKKFPDDDRPIVFFAGSIDMGAAEDWQAKLDEALKDVDCVILNPRREDWDSTWKQEMENPEFSEQVNWELHGMEVADVVALCLTKGSKAPISLLELGLHAAEGKMVVCCPDGFWRKGNVDIVCDKYDVPVFEDFDEFAEAVKERLESIAKEA